MTPDTEASEFDFFVLLSVLRARWLLIACFVLGATSAAIAYIALVQPVYRSTVVMISASPERSSLGGVLSSTLGPLGSLGSIAGLNMGGDSTVEEALAVLRSRSFGEEFIKEFSLMPQFFPDDWDEKNQTWASSSGHEPTLASGFAYFDRHVRSVIQDRRTGLISLSVDWYDPDEAASWANALPRRINAEMRQRAIANSDVSISFLENQLNLADNLESRAAISRLLEAQIKQRMLATVTEDYAFRVVDGALPADRTQPLRPQRVPILLAAPIAGFILGVLAAIALHFLRRARARPA